jgi:hypothetical protein
MTNGAKFLCYLDILGFKNRIPEDRFRKCYESIIDKVQAKIFGGNIYCISDSIILVSVDFRTLVDQIFAIYSTALNEGMFLRGAITRGNINELGSVQASGSIVVIPYLGEAYLKAHNLEQNINCAAICIDIATYNELKNEEKELIFSYKELFPKGDISEEKLFLISDMNNWSVPQTILCKISQQINDLSSHDLLKFLDTFCLYYKVMNEKYQDTNNLEKYHQWWIEILKKL